jgi:hypothetical protein
MLACESLDACISVRMVEKSSISRSSHPIPSVEFSPTDGSEDGGKFFIKTNPLKQVHIVEMSVSRLSMAEGLILVHLLSGADGDVIAIRSHRNVIVCKIADRRMVSCREGTKDKDCAESCDPSPEREPKPRLDGPDENACFTPPINFLILHTLSTTTHNKYLAP